MGCPCRYDATDNLNTALLDQLKKYELIPFCPEDHAFGSPRPTMDLIQACDGAIDAVSNATGCSLSSPIRRYAQNFFDTHPDIDLFIGKDRSPSCGVTSAKIYDPDKKLLSTNGTGVMAEEAKRRGITSVDSEVYGRLLEEKS